MKIAARGFTLVEVVVILVVLSILAAVAIPMAFRIFQVTAEDTTREEMANLKKAMIGDPQRLQTSFRNDFGFLGDIGRIPANLDEILLRGSLSVFAFDTAKQAGAGWKGPYITGAAAGEEPEDFKKDQWGNAYAYDDTDYVNANSELVDGKITSAGPDGSMITTADNIVLEILKNETTATARGKVKDTSGVGLEAVPVEFYSAVNGVLTTTTASTDASGNYTFTSVPFGPRSVRPLPRLVLAPGTVVNNGGGQDIEFKVINYSTSAYTITQMRADFGGGSNYDQIRINGNTVDSSNNFVNGQVVNVTSTNIAASPATRPSTRVIVDNPDTQLPDITITGQGTTATIELNNFNNDMTGFTIKVTFNPAGASSVVTFVVPP